MDRYEAEQHFRFWDRQVGKLKIEVRQTEVQLSIAKQHRDAYKEILENDI